MAEARTVLQENLGPGREDGLEERVSRLERILKEHSHLGTDGSSNLKEDTDLAGRTLTLSSPGISAAQSANKIPVAIFAQEENDSLKDDRRLMGSSILVIGRKGSASEQVNNFNVVGIAISESDPDALLPINQADFNKMNAARIRLVHSTFGTPGEAGPSSFPPLTFLIADRTPLSNSSGAISGDTLKDVSANYVENQLVSSIIFLEHNLESHKIVANGKNTITIDGEWATEAGTYNYFIITTVLLGSASQPFSRLFVGEDIRMGYGSSGGSQVGYIKWGRGSPEGKITANPGSMYLNFDGGAGATLWVKESGPQTNTGWAAK